MTATMTYLAQLANVTQRQAVNFAVCIASAVLPSWWPVAAIPLVLTPLNMGVPLEGTGIATSLCAAVAVRCFGVVVRAAMEMGAAFALLVVLQHAIGSPLAVPIVVHAAKKRPIKKRPVVPT